MRERTLVVVKPDAVIDGRSEEIKNFFGHRSMDILIERHIWFTPEMLKRFYGFEISKESFEKMVNLFKKSFAVLLIFEGENAVEIGKEAKRFFRKKYNYGYYGCTIHTSDSIEEYVKEIKVLSATDPLF